MTEKRSLDLPLDLERVVAGVPGTARHRGGPTRHRDSHFGAIGRSPARMLSAEGAIGKFAEVLA